MPTTINQLNHCEPAEFMALLGGIYEHSPWVAEQVMQQRPFTDLSSLHTAMKSAVASASGETKLQLLRAHP